MTSPAEPVSQAGPPPAAPPAKGGKIFGMPRSVAVVAIAGTVALGLVWWRSRHSAAAAAGAATAAATSATAQTVGLQDQLAQLQDEINSLQAQGIGAGSSGGATTPPAGSTSTPPPSTSTPPPSTTPAQPTVTVPKVEGMSANTAIGFLTSAGLKYHLNIVRNPVNEYVVFSQTPGAGAKVPKGSTVDLGIRQK